MPALLLFALGSILYAQQSAGEDPGPPSDLVKVKDDLCSGRERQGRLKNDLSAPEFGGSRSPGGKSVTYLQDVNDDQFRVP
jgi:hypothetical protein